MSALTGDELQPVRVVSTPEQVREHQQAAIRILKAPAAQTNEETTVSDVMPDDLTRALAAASGVDIQADPVPNGSPSMHDLVADDLRRRRDFGLRKYGTLLQAGNGRDALRDAYDEALDLAVYLRQAIEERDSA